MRHNGDERCTIIATLKHSRGTGIMGHGVACPTAWLDDDDDGLRRAREFAPEKNPDSNKRKDQDDDR
jgi:hypothetical protein